MKTNNRGPAFQFYPDKWTSATFRLSLEAYCVYHKILCWMWEHSDNGYSISADCKCIARAIGVDITTTEMAMSEIMGDKLLKVNNRNQNRSRYESFGLKKETRKQHEWRKKSAKGGRTPPKPKPNKELQGKGGSRVVQPTPQPFDNTLTPTPTVSPTPTVLEEGEPPKPPYEPDNELGKYDAVAGEFNTQTGNRGGKKEWVTQEFYNMCNSDLHTINTVAELSAAIQELPPGRTLAVKDFCFRFKVVQEPPAPKKKEIPWANPPGGPIIPKEKAE